MGFPRFPARGGARRFPASTSTWRRRSPSFIEEQGRVVGVRLADGREVRARLTIAADGRASIVRASCFRSRTSARRWTCSGSASPRQAQAKGGLRGNVERGRLLVLIDRGDYWQCAFLIPKGAAEDYQARGIDAIRDEVAAAAPPDLDLSRTRRDQPTCIC